MACIWLVFVVFVRSDWLILGHYSPVMSRGRLWACKNKEKPYNLLISHIRSLLENLKPRPCCIDLALARSIRQGVE